LVDAFVGSWNGTARRWDIEEAMAERTDPEDLLGADVVLLASGTWDVRGIEGQLNPHMWVLLHDKAADPDLAGKPCACIALGDDRYFYTARAADHLEHYVRSHHGPLLPTLRIINAPYGQDAIVSTWAAQLLSAANSLTGN
jgi:flavodoxin I